MPYSDNLYSANDGSDESDRESFSNELSPTDGFFNRSRMPPDALVPDPTHRGCTAEDKVLIARHEARADSERAPRPTSPPTLSQLFPSQSYASPHSHHNPSSSTSNTPSMPISSLRTDSPISDHTPLMQGPPPAYTPSSPTSVNTTHANRDYNTFAPIAPHLLEQGLFPHREPQNMGRPVDNPDERTPSSNRRNSQRRVFVRKLLFVLLVIAVVVPVTMSLLNWRSYDDPDHSDATKPPPIGSPGHSSSPYCPSATFKNHEIIHEFAMGRDLIILQTIHDGDGPRNNAHFVTTTGEIRLRRLPKDSKYEGGYISIDINVSDPNLHVLKSWDTGSYTLNVSTPRHTHLGTSGLEGRTHCISLEITAWLPEDAKLLRLGLESVTLTLQVFDDIKTSVSGSSWFASVTGDVYFPTASNSDPMPPTDYPFDSREIVVETVSGDIKGIYPLYDYLKLSSQSGDITAGVYPQAVLPSAPAPANLEISTASGDIQVNLPVQIPRYSPPPRDYVTKVGSVSGDINGGFFLGSTGNFKSTSGEVKMKILPVIQSSGSTDPDKAPKSHFETWTVSGNTQVELLDPVFITLPPSGRQLPEERHSPDPYIPIGDDDPYLVLPPHLKQDLSVLEGSSKLSKKWRTLESSHRSSSGQVRVLYPDIWEGTVSAGTLSGAIVVKGDGLKIIKSNSGWGHKELVAAKGVDAVGEGSTAAMTDISGDLKFIVGEQAE